MSYRTKQDRERRSRAAPCTPSRPSMSASPHNTPETLTVEIRVTRSCDATTETLVRADEPTRKTVRAVLYGRTWNATVDAQGVLARKTRHAVVRIVAVGRDSEATPNLEGARVVRILAALVAGAGTSRQRKATLQVVTPRVETRVSDLAIVIGVAQERLVWAARAKGTHPTARLEASPSASFARSPAEPAGSPDAAGGTGAAVTALSTKARGWAQRNRHSRSPLQRPARSKQRIALGRVAAGQPLAEA